MTASTQDAWALDRILKMLESGTRSAVGADDNFTRLHNEDRAGEWRRLGFRLAQLRDAVRDGLFDQLDATADTAADEFGVADHRFDDAPASGPDAAELPMLRAFGVAAYLQRAAADVDFGHWSVGRDTVKASLIGSVPPDVARAQLRMLADRFDLTYSEKPFVETKTECSARGVIGGIAVHFQEILNPAEADRPALAPEAAANHSARVTQNSDLAARLQHIAPTAAWSIFRYSVSGFISHDNIDEARATIRRIADENGWTYTEDPRPDSGPDAILVQAAGRFGDVDVEIWDIRNEVRAVAVEAPARAEGWYSPDAVEYFPDAGSVPTAEELAEGEWMDYREAADVARIQHEMDLDAGAECDPETCAFCGGA